MTDTMKDRIVRFRERAKDWRHHERFLAAANEALSLLSDCQQRIEDLEQQEVFEKQWSDKLKEFGTIDRLIEAYRESKMKTRKAEAENRKLREAGEAMVKFYDSVSWDNSDQSVDDEHHDRIEQIEAALADKWETHPHTVSHDEQQAEQSDPCDICGVPRHSHGPGRADRGGE